ncbi:MAG: protein translocase subunit SecF [Myxococcales bacterium]|nr:protein translocase subunit SecF [Myxococcales bacterium]
MRWLKPGRDYDFMGLRWYFITASIFLNLLALFSFFVWPGLKWGTDFRGGTEIEVAFETPVEAAAVRGAVEAAGFGAPDVVAVPGARKDNTYLVRVQEVSALSDEQKELAQKVLCLAATDESADCPKGLRSDEVKFSPGGDKITVRYQKDVEVCGPPEVDPANPDAKIECPPRAEIGKQLTGRVPGIELRAGRAVVVQNVRERKVDFLLKGRGEQMMDGLRAALGATVPEQPERSEWVGAKAGKDLRDAAITSVLIAIIFVMGYIAFRFDVRFAPGAIVAMIHDVLIAAGVIVLAGHEITLSTIAALLTIVGYSIMDTVVVYDRVRENLGRHRKMSFPAIINKAITEMLGRTIKTSLTTLLSLLPFMFWGTTLIKNFALTLIAGIIVGTYSSIFIAAPFTEWIDRRFYAGKTMKKTRRIVRKAAAADPGSVPAG